MFYWNSWLALTLAFLSTIFDIPMSTCFDILNTWIKFLAVELCKFEQICWEWVSAYTTSFMVKDVTPYMHVLMNHVAESLQLHGTMSHFNQQTMEKLNDTIISLFFHSSNQNYRSFVQPTEWYDGHIHIMHWPKYQSCSHNTPKFYYLKDSSQCISYWLFYTYRGPFQQVVYKLSKCVTDVMLQARYSCCECSLKFSF